MMTPMHRSMHDLHSAAGGSTAGFMMPAQAGPGSLHSGQFPHHQRPLSPSKTSQKSKRSSGNRDKYRKARRRNTEIIPRPHSRSASSRNSRVRHGSSAGATSTDDEDSEEEDEDFFTGESDAGGNADFVSLSSGSNANKRASAPAPRKSWMCEHCTFVNNPGVIVCSMCCRTSRHSRGEATQEEKSPVQPENIITAPQSNNKISGKSKAKNGNKSRSTRYNSTDEEDEFEEEQGRHSPNVSTILLRLFLLQFFPKPIRMHQILPNKEKL
jgi:hypothetical protein